MPDPALVPAAASSYGAIAVLAASALGMVAATMLAVRVITRVANRLQGSAARATTYECGEEAIGSAWIRFNNRFYLIAILFLGCDAILALLLPVLPLVAGTRSAWGLGVVLGGLAVIGLLVAHAARRGDLHWNKAVGHG
jgi:NADH-quinone oxidoreductase subunit A